MSVNALDGKLHKHKIVAHRYLHEGARDIREVKAYVNDELVNWWFELVYLHEPWNPHWLRTDGYP